MFELKNLPAGKDLGKILYISVKNNNIVIASIFGDLTVKKLKKKEKSLFLVSANED